MGRKKERVKQEREKNLREKMAETLDIAKEVLLDTTQISCVGDGDITLENYKSIVSYSDTEIEIKAKLFTVKICGHRLELRNITGDLLYITGRISQISFIK